MIYTQTPYRIEPELALSRPRRVRFTRSTQKRRLRTWCLSLVPFVVVVAYGLHAADVDEALLTRGAVTNARVTSTSVVDSGRSSKSGVMAQASIMFEFRANGIVVLGRGVDDNDYRRKLKVGDSLAVTYLPENPRSFVQGLVAHWQVVQKDLDWILSGAFFAIFGCIYIFITERYFWQRRLLLREGKPIGATVVGHQTAESGETATYFVRYEYPDAAGKKIVGRMAVSPKRARDFPDGSKLTVVCRPDSRESGVPYALITEAEIVKAH